MAPLLNTVAKKGQEMFEILYEPYDIDKFSKSLKQDALNL